MAFGIPNSADAAFGDQAEPDSQDFAGILVQGFALHGVESGCAVSAQGTPDMTVAVAAGVVRHGGARVVVSAGNVTITAADATNPRFDLITVNSSGTKAAVAGTAASNPVFPSPSGNVVLAAVYVPANDTDIDADQITDKRVLVREPAYENPKWYGAVIDGSTDDLTAWDACMAATVAKGGGRISWWGSMALSASIDIDDDGIEVVGFGGSVANGPFTVWNPTSEVVRTGAGTTPMLRVNGPVQGFVLRGVGLSGNSVATHGISADQMVASLIQNVGVRELDATTGIGLYLNSTEVTNANYNSMKNRIADLYVSAPVIIELDGTGAAAANTCHNQFININGDYGDATNNSNGINLKDCDNNSFFGVFLNRAAGTGYGVIFQALARGNYFFHLEAGAGGARADTPTNASDANSIYGYDRENGQPAPSLGSNARLLWTEYGSNMEGWRVPVFQGSILLGDATSDTVEAAFNETGLGMQVVSDVAGVAPQIRLQALQNGTSGFFDVDAKGAGGASHRGRFGVISNGEMTIGGISSAVFAGFRTNNTLRGRLDENGNWRLGEGLLATTATNGFVHIPAGAGPPTGTPTYTTLPALYYDTTNGILYVYTGGAWRTVSATDMHADFAFAGTLTTATGAFRWYNDTGRTLTFRSVRASAGTAPASQAIICDVNVDGTTIWSTQSNRVQVAAAANTGESTTFNTTTITDGQYLTVDVDQVGTGTAGADLTVVIWMRG